MGAGFAEGEDTTVNKGAGRSRHRGGGRWVEVDCNDLDLSGHCVKEGDSVENGGVVGVYKSTTDFSCFSTASDIFVWWWPTSSHMTMVAWLMPHKLVCQVFHQSRG